jgi:transcription elongation factor GreA
MVLENVDTEETVVYQMVGIDESNIEKGRISISSPLGKALLGKEPGDEVSINAPGGKRHYELVEIR